MSAAAGCEEEKETIRATSSCDEWLGAGRGRQAQGSRSRQGREKLRIEDGLDASFLSSQADLFRARVFFIVGRLLAHKPAGGTRIPTISLPFWCLDARITDVVLRLH